MKRMIRFTMSAVVLLLVVLALPSMLAAQDDVQVAEASVQRLYTEVFDAGRLDAIDDLAADGFIDMDAPRVSGCTCLKEAVARLQEQYTNLRVTDVHWVIDRDLAVAEVTFEGEINYQIGDQFMPSGTTVSWTQTDIVRLEGGKLTNLWMDYPLAQLAE